MYGMKVASLLLMHSDEHMQGVHHKSTLLIRWSCKERGDTIDRGSNDRRRKDACGVLQPCP